MRRSAPSSQGEKPSHVALPATARRRARNRAARPRTASTSGIVTSISSLPAHAEVLPSGVSPVRYPTGARMDFEHLTKSHSRPLAHLLDVTTQPGLAYLLESNSLATRNVIAPVLGRRSSEQYSLQTTGNDRHDGQPRHPGAAPRRAGAWRIETSSPPASASRT